MLRIKRICGRDFGELERELNNFLKDCEKLHYHVLKIDFINLRENTNVNAFVQYETFDQTEVTEEEY